MYLRIFSKELICSGNFGYNVFFFMGLHYTSTMNGSLIIATIQSNKDKKLLSHNHYDSK